MKQYSKKAIGLILLIVITSLVLAFLVAGVLYFRFHCRHDSPDRSLVPAPADGTERPVIPAFCLVGTLFRLPFFGHNTPGTVGCPPARTDRSGGRGFAIL